MLTALPAHIYCLHQTVALQGRLCNEQSTKRHNAQQLYLMDSALTGHTASMPHGVNPALAQTLVVPTTLTAFARGLPSMLV